MKLLVIPLLIISVLSEFQDDPCSLVHCGYGTCEVDASDQTICVCNPCYTSIIGYNCSYNCFRDKLEKNPLEVQLSHEKRMEFQLLPKNIVIAFDCVLGKGSDATVYKGYIKKKSYAPENILNLSPTNGVAALKMPNTFELDHVEEFGRELDSLIYLGNHPHIISFYGWTLYRDIPVLVTEVASGNLLQYSRNLEIPLPIKEILSLLWQVSQALEHVASLAMVHR